MDWRTRTTAFLKRTRAEWLTALVGFAAVIALAAATSSAAQAWGAALLILGMVVGGFISVAIHEFGHAIAAWLVGWRVWIISAVPICQRLGHTFRFTTQAHHDIGGFVLASPPTSERDVRWRGVTYSLGGPLASLIAGPAFIYWLTTFPPGSWESPERAGMLGAALALAFHSCMGAAYTLWPGPINGRPNDMTMALASMFGPRMSPDEKGYAWARALFELGVEPAVWPDWIRAGVRFHAAKADADPLAQTLAFAIAVESADLATARAHTRGEHNAAKIMRAYLAALEGDADAASSDLAGAGQPPPWSALARLRALTLAHIHAADGKPDAAHRVLDTLAEELINNPTPLPFWDALLARARSAIGAQRTSTPAPATAARGPWTHSR